MNFYLVIATILTLVAINIAFAYLIYQLLKKIKSAKPDGLTLIQFPSETEKKIKDLINGINQFTNLIDRSVNTDQKKNLTGSKRNSEGHKWPTKNIWKLCKRKV